MSGVLKGHHVPLYQMNQEVQSRILRFMVQDERLIRMAKHHILKMYDMPEDMVYFPGALPVSLMRKDLEALREIPYMVAEKTDGVRHLLLIFHDGTHSYTLFVDRGFRFYYYSCKFSRSLYTDLGTLLDGEMILERGELKFLVHDIMCVRGKREVAHLNYQDRMYHVQELLRWHCFPPDQPEMDFILLLPKQVFPLHQLAHLWNDIIPKLHHRCDGLIFTPDNVPHIGKKNKLLFKWKQPCDHTIDLQLDRLTTEPKQRSRYPTFLLKTWDTISYIPFCEISLSYEEWRALGVEEGSKMLGAIVECRFDRHRDTWSPVNFRPDKVKPNDVSTVKLTINTIYESLTIIEILNLVSHLKPAALPQRASDLSRYYKP
jgi:hypothetical protein